MKPHLFMRLGGVLDYVPLSGSQQIATTNPIINTTQIIKNITSIDSNFQFTIYIKKDNIYHRLTDTFLIYVENKKISDLSLQILTKLFTKGIQYNKEGVKILSQLSFSSNHEFIIIYTQESSIKKITNCHIENKVFNINLFDPKMTMEFSRNGLTYQDFQIELIALFGKLQPQQLQIHFNHIQNYYHKLGFTNQFQGFYFQLASWNYTTKENKLFRNNISQITPTFLIKNQTDIYIFINLLINAPKTLFADLNSPEHHQQYPLDINKFDIAPHQFFIKDTKEINKLINNKKDKLKHNEYENFNYTILKDKNIILLNHCHLTQFKRNV